MTGDLVKWLGTPPTIAAGMARKTTDGHNWYGSIPRDLARNNPRDFFAIVFWSDQCRDWDASVDVASYGVSRNMGGWRIQGHPTLLDSIGDFRKVGAIHGKHAAGQ